MADPLPASPDYGLDAPTVVRNLTIGGVACFATGAVLYIAVQRVSTWGSYALLAWGLLAGVSMCGTALLMTRSSRSGKLKERDALLDSLQLKGNEVVLDLGWPGVTRSPLRWGMFPPVRIVRAARPPTVTGAA